MDWSKYPNFKQSEMACKCGCGFVNISKKLMDMLQKARTIAGIPFVINSACRCLANNTKEGGSLASDHLASKTKECFGVDIAVNGDRSAFIIERALIKAGFDRIGHYLDKSIIHAGIGKESGGTNDSRVRWVKR